MPALFILLSGCASIPPEIAELEASPASLELVDTPFFPQERYQCGPAALATAISSSGIEVDVQDLVDRVYLPGRQGSLQVEMLAATRSVGRLPYVIDGTLQALWNELAAGRPVVVLQNLGVALIPRWHFAVVVGVDTEQDAILLRSGVEQRRVTSLKTFLRTWRRSDYWGFIVLRPEELPADADRQRYQKAVAALEKAGRSEEAAVAWKMAINQWPGNPVALFGLGNIELSLGNDPEAEAYFRAVVERDAKSVAARNNLAIALARQGRYAEAMRELSIAREDASDPAIAAELADTEALIVELSRDAAAPD
ncbi:MAG: PA2778 family cysteine peptidase [Gammaproteobacteria bacterium]|nr:PA2778 family cysteine peptidase [Gammaproteobacteria bacterium]MDH3777810.1 PA2778 family cysteine peptidase [Gammaproteobacteria bacterium]MDH3810383.1 PA2778 family cysteine peptidase [Gammaproteobacteria bacterium]